MIKNNKHAAAQNKLTLLEASLAQTSDSALPDIIRETGAGQLQDLIAELRAEIEEYEASATAKADFHNDRIAL